MDENKKQQQQRVDRGNLAIGFEESESGRLVIGWLNDEVRKLTLQLAEDDELDKDNVKRAGVRGALKAYRLIGDKLAMTKMIGAKAQRTLEENGQAQNENIETPEEIAQRAGL